jgi:hypothetical protein
MKLSDNNLITVGASEARFVYNGNNPVWTNRTESNLVWDASVDTYTAATTATTVTNIHRGMRRCVLNMDGSVNYYLDPNDSTLKADGTAANLTGADGYVMVEIPRFWYRYSRVGDVITWEIADRAKPGFTIHPAFIKDGVEVAYRYMGAYDACFLDATDGVYKSGLNLDNASSLFNTSEDKLASVSGVYPLVGATRAECRTMASNNGTGWRQQDFWTSSAVQLLYLIEYGTFNSQAVLGDGNTNDSYTASPGTSNQNDSPHTIAGASNSWGNNSTDGSQPSAGSKPGTAYMSYRGIENFFGNCWNWVDGFNSINRVAWVTNTQAHFVDDTTANLTNLGTMASSANGFARDIINTPVAFLPSSTSGGSSSTFITDFFFQNTGNRVARLGGAAILGSNAGVFYWAVFDASSDRLRNRGARVCF